MQLLAVLSCNRCDFQGKRPITVDLAIRVGKALGNGYSLWLSLQQKVNVWDAWHAHQEDYDRVLTLA